MNAAPLGTLKVGDKVATLTMNGWQSADARLAAFLNTAYSVDGISPADGTPGYRLLSRAAGALGGEATYAPVDHDDVPGRVY